MKKDRIIYCAATLIVAAVMFISAVNFAFSESSKEAFHHLGLPNWFKIELTVAKFLGVGALLLPGIPEKIREFAYFGFAITLISAAIAHLSSGDSVLLELGHSFFFIALVVSYRYYHKGRKSGVL